MRHRYLEVTFRNGKLIAAYLYLPRRPGDVSAHTERQTDGLLVDYTTDGRAIGIEITAPSRVSLEAINSALNVVHQEPATPEELAPLAAA
ncbi:MAG: DUF2283 domain-containing protein [Phycisphaerales bacterium]|nr:DUF2283 domain-containing protein [Phycisphaerales bacterium]